MKGNTPMKKYQVRTYSQTHPKVGFIQFSIPVMNPQDVEAYAIRKAKDLPAGERFILVNQLLDS